MDKFVIFLAITALIALFTYTAFHTKKGGSFVAKPKPKTDVAADTVAAASRKA
jgi:hypothetical protein